MSTFNCGRCCKCLRLDVFRCLRKMCMFTIPFACGCRYTCVCVCCAYASMHAHMHVHVCVCVSEHTCVLLLFHVHVSMCTYRYTHVFVCVAHMLHACAYTCARVRVRVCMLHFTTKACAHASMHRSRTRPKRMWRHAIYTCGDALWEERAPAFISKKNNIRKMRDPLCSGSRTRPSR